MFAITALSLEMPIWKTSNHWRGQVNCWHLVSKQRAHRITFARGGSLGITRDAPHPPARARPSFIWAPASTCRQGQVHGGTLRREPRIQRQHPTVHLFYFRCQIKVRQ